MNHISSGSSGNRVMVPDPSRSIACFTRRIVVVVVATGETVGDRSLVLLGQDGHSQYEILAKMNFRAVTVKVVSMMSQGKRMYC